MSVDLSSHADGAVDLKFRMLSKSDNKEKDKLDFEIAKDTVAPVVTLSSLSDGQYINAAANGTSYVLSGLCQDSTKNTIVKVDDVAVTNYTSLQSCMGEEASTWSISFDSTLLSEGSHTLKVELGDGLGNIGQNSPITFIKDTTIQLFRSNCFSRFLCFNICSSVGWRRCFIKINFFTGWRRACCGAY